MQADSLPSKPPGKPNYFNLVLGFAGGSAGKESACNAEDLGLFLGWEDPLEVEKATHSSILALGNPMDRGAWRATVHEVEKESDKTEQLNNDNNDNTVLYT